MLPNCLTQTAVLPAFILAGIREHARTGEQPEWGRVPNQDEVGLMHASPPCQGLSGLNRYRSLPALQRDLFPLLGQARA